MYDGVGFARFMSYRRWHHKALDRLKVSVEEQNFENLSERAEAELLASAKHSISSSYLDCPKCPVWMPVAAELDTARIFSRLRGLITYGSPLETFARTWPAVIEINSEAELPPDFEWINLYDPTDVVAPKLLLFKNAMDDTKISPRNVEVDLSYFIGRSHIQYFALPTDFRQHRVVSQLNSWMLDGTKRFEPGYAMEEEHITHRRFALVAQALLILFIGGLLWPIATLSVLSFIGFIIGGFLRVVSYALRNFALFNGASLDEISSDIIERAQSFVAALNPTDDWFQSLVHVGTIYGIILAVVAIASFMHFLRDVVRDRRKYAKPSEPGSGGRAAAIRLEPTDSEVSVNLERPARGLE